MDTVAGLRSLHTGDFKLTYTPIGAERGTTETISGDDDQKMIEQALDMGIGEFSISKTSLEDVYLTIVGHREAIPW